MKTINSLILIIAIIIPISFGILYTFPNQILHATLEIHGMKYSYIVGEKYSFYYTLEGFGRICHSVMVSYPNYDGQIIGWGRDSDCNTEIQNKEFFYDSREHGFHHNSLVPQIPGIYKVSVHIENIQPVIFEFRVFPDAIFDDKIFVNKCESNGGVWNYTYHDCQGLSFAECKDLGGIFFSEDVTLPCTTEVCLDMKLYRMSCVFEYEN